MVTRILSAALFLFVSFGIGLSACDSSSDSASSSDNSAAAYTGEYIYVSSGTSFPGTGLTASAAVNVISRFKATDGSFDRIVRDYSANAADTPTDIAHYDDDHILVAVENAASRRLEIVAKDGSSVTTWATNAALTQALGAMARTPDGGVLVAKGTASPNGTVEKFNSSAARVTSGANPFVNAPAGTCATSTTRFSGIAVGPSDSIFLAHAAASTNNQIDIISSNGYSVGGDCLGGIDGPTANHIPTRILYHSVSGKMLVAYGNNTGPVHQIYQYTVTSNSIGSAAVAFNNTSVVQGPSAMAQDSDGNVYIASGVSTFNTIEKFTFDGTTLTRVGTSPLIGPSIFTRSISGLLVE